MINTCYRSGLLRQPRININPRKCVLQAAFSLQSMHTHDGTRIPAAASLRKLPGPNHAGYMAPCARQEAVPRHQEAIAGEEVRLDKYAKPGTPGSQHRHSRQT